MGIMAHQDLMRLFTRYAGTCLERWRLIKNQKVIHKDRGQGTVDKIWKEQNRIVFSVKYYDEKAPIGLRGKRGFLLPDFTYLALPNDARKPLQHWIANKALNPAVEAEYSLLSLDESDVQLVGMWCRPMQKNLDEQSIIDGKSDQKWHYGRLLSARSAEKIAIKFYRNYGKDVRDISITQIGENHHSDWKSYDLDIDEGSAYVDVKNARKSQNSEDRYCGYCVPEFKQGRENREVTLAGVFSPYLYADEILKPTDYSEDRRAIFLGETNLARLKELREEFDSLVSFSSEKPGVHAFLPPWVFDYPDYVYTARNKALDDFKSFSKAAKSTNTPVVRSVVAVAIASASDLLMVLNHNTWNAWERTFICQLNERIGKFGLSLPFVFLTVLAHFLDMVTSSQPNSDFNPSKYRPLLFWGENSRPLGIYDPLNTIDALIKALNTLWTADNGLIRKFKLFKLMSFNILKGKTDRTDSNWTTLIAYCGGRMPEDGSACGKNPLILGESKLCDRGYLICPECGYCCKTCEELTATDNLADMELPDGLPYF